PLSHHVFDSTHIAFGVATVSLDMGPVTVEGSAFNGREPDEHRWNFDFGRMDSVSGRVWIRPAPSIAIQISRGHLVNPEALEPGDVTRWTTSASWWQQSGDTFTALTAAYGENEGHGSVRPGAFVEASRQQNRLTVSARLESVKVETATLLGLE